MNNKWLHILCFLVVFQSAAAADEELSFVAEETSSGILVYIHNATSGEANIKNTLNLRGKGSSLSPVSLNIESEDGNKYSEVMIVDSADVLTCLLLRRNAVHGIIYKHAYIKKMFHLDPGRYRVQAIYEDHFCNKNTAVKIESKWIEININ